MLKFLRTKRAVSRPGVQESGSLGVEVSVDVHTFEFIEICARMGPVHITSYPVARIEERKQAGDIILDAREVVSTGPENHPGFHGAHFKSVFEQGQALDFYFAVLAELRRRYDSAPLIGGRQCGFLAPQEVAVFCWQGWHASVAVAELLASFLRERFARVLVQHSQMEHWRPECATGNCAECSYPDPVYGNTDAFEGIGILPE